MLTIGTLSGDTLNVRRLDADAASGDMVLAGVRSKAQVRRWVRANLEPPVTLRLERYYQRHADGAMVEADW